MRTAIVTGASSGIGEEAARRLSREGYTVMVVARRADRLETLAAEIGGMAIAVDLLDEDAPARLRAHMETHHDGRLDLLVNNAGAAWRSTFAEGGYANVRRHMALNFDAQVRVTEALLPLLRASAPSAIVNVASTAGRVGRKGSGAYSASKFAFIGFSESLHLEEAEYGVHVGTVLPGFVATEGFPQQELVDNPRTRWAVSTPAKVADAIVDCANGKAERYVPRAYGLIPVINATMGGLVRRAGRGGGFATKTNAQ